MSYVYMLRVPRVYTSVSLSRVSDEPQGWGRAGALEGCSQRMFHASTWGIRVYMGPKVGYVYVCLRVHVTCATCVHLCVRVMGSLRVSDEPQDREELGPWRVVAGIEGICFVSLMSHSQGYLV